MRRSGVVRCRGFTLLEAVLTTMIVGIGITGTMRLAYTCAQQNMMAGHMTTGMHLASHIREAMARLPFNDPLSGPLNFGAEPGELLADFDDVDDFDGQIFNPPIDARRQPLSGFDAYSQEVVVWPVYPNKLSVNTNPANPDIPKATYTGAVRVQVRILHRAAPTASPVEVCRMSWIAMD